MSDLRELPRNDEPNRLSESDEAELSIPIGEVRPENQFRKLKLISVNLKEAALDSPTFRASVNHLDNQILKIEKWLVALESSVKKIPKYAHELQTFCNSFLGHLVPAFLQDGLIDQEYTISSMEATLKGLKQLWSTSLSALNVDTYIIENLSLIVFKNLGRYKEVRKAYLASQAKYDKYLEFYLSTPKTKDPAGIAEDAKQVFAVRQEYIHASLDLVVELSSMGSLLDKVLVRMSTDIWKNKRQMFNASSKNADLFRDSWIKIQRIQSWCDLYSSSVEKLGADMMAARQQVEESALAQFRPSTNINDYNPSLISQHTLDMVDEPSIEKHGYLFMKTWTEKSSKPVWVKRMAFIKGGIFGLLVLSSSQTFVQETDKLGILLCNVRHTPNEDRRFCFELKTSDLTVVFQAETLLELKSWLKVFTNERSRILNHASRDNELFNIASGRYPPVIAELSNTQATMMDRELTSSKVVHHSSGQIITPSNLSKHIERNDKMFSKYVYKQIIQIKPPFITDTTKSSILSYSLVSATSVPTALTANIWGSVNWGTYYLHASVSEEKVKDTPVIQHDYELVKLQQQERDSGVYYPPYYPKELVPLDIQMRALFDTVVDPGEYCLYSCRSVWAPNSRQELSGRCFITINHVYFYMQALGFVSLTKGFVGRLVAVDCKRSRQYDIVKMYGTNGVVKIKLFLDDGFAMKRKLNYLIENKISDKPKLMKDIFPEFQKIDELLQHEKEELARANSTNGTNGTGMEVQPQRTPCPEVVVTIPPPEEKPDSQSPVSPPAEKLVQPPASSEPIDYKTQVQRTMSQVSKHDPLSSFQQTPNNKTVEYRIDFSDECSFLMDKTYSIPPKAVFHALLGDKSYLLEESLPFGMIESVVKKPWSTSPDGKLYRVFDTVANYTRKRWVVRINQKIDNLVDNEYYTFTHTRSKLVLRLGSNFSITHKYVLLSVSGDKTRVLVYLHVNFSGRSLLNGYIHSLAERISKNNCALLHKELKATVKEIGTHGPIVRAIYLYGKLSHEENSTSSEKSESEMDESELPFMKISFFHLHKVILRRYLFVIVGLFIHSAQLLFNGGISLLKALKMQQFLVFVILISTLFNVFLVGKTTTTYWTVRRANKIAYDYFTHDPLRLERAIYSKDTQDLLLQRHQWQSQDWPSNSSDVCFNAYKNASFILNFQEPTFWNDIYGDESTKQVAKDIKKSFRDIGAKRHKLLVDLEILSRVEEDLAKAEWRNWLMSEVSRCELVTESVLPQLLGNEEENFRRGSDSIVSYCQDCANELRQFDLL